jgi:glucokinase
MPDESPESLAPRHEVAILAIDIGDPRMSVGLVTPQGDLIDRDSVKIDPDLSANALFDSLDSLVQSQVSKSSETHHRRVVAIGVGVQGHEGTDADRVSPPGIRAWREFPLRERLHTAAMLPVFGDESARGLALAEGWLGAAAGRENFFGVVVGTGIGGGIVLNGTLFDGATGHAGHIGHIIVEPNGRRCWCGARGCLEAEASGAAIEAITGRPPSAPTYDIMQRTGKLVGRAVASVCNVLDLDLAVIGGDVAASFGATFFNAAQETLDDLAKVSYSKGARVTPSRLGDRAPLVGAGAIGIRGMRRRSKRAA